MKINVAMDEVMVEWQNKDADIIQAFFKTVQNKLHWAIAGGIDCGSSK